MNIDCITAREISPTRILPWNIDAVRQSQVLRMLNQEGAAGGFFLNWCGTQIRRLHWVWALLCGSRSYRDLSTFDCQRKLIRRVHEFNGWERPTIYCSLTDFRNRGSLGQLLWRVKQKFLVPITSVPKRWLEPQSRLLWISFYHFYKRLKMRYVHEEIPRKIVRTKSKL